MYLIHGWGEDGVIASAERDARSTVAEDACGAATFAEEACGAATPAGGDVRSTIAEEACGAATSAETACVAYGSAASKTAEASRDDDVNGSTPKLAIPWRWETKTFALQAKPRLHGR